MLLHVTDITLKRGSYDSILESYLFYCIYTAYMNKPEVLFSSFFFKEFFYKMSCIIDTNLEGI